MTDALEDRHLKRAAAFQAAARRNPDKAEDLHAAMRAEMVAVEFLRGQKERRSAPKSGGEES